MNENKELYNELLNNYLKAIKIIKELLVNAPPKDFHTEDIIGIRSVLEQWEQMANDKKNQNISFLKQSISELLTYYQEGSDPHVELFWKKLKEENIPFKRENKMLKILKRKKIKDAVEYDFVVDIIVPYLQEGLITEDESAALNKMIGEYEERMFKGTKPRR